MRTSSSGNFPLGSLTPLLQIFSFPDYDLNNSGQKSQTCIFISISCVNYEFGLGMRFDSQSISTLLPLQDNGCHFLMATIVRLSLRCDDRRILEEVFILGKHALRQIQYFPAWEAVCVCVCVCGGTGDFFAAGNYTCILR